MSDAVRVATILGFSLIVTSILLGGIYSIVPLAPHAAAYRYNRFTGSAELLDASKAKQVVPEPESTPEPKNVKPPPKGLFD
jgi:hypothetical protein